MFFAQEQGAVFRVCFQFSETILHEYQQQQGSHILRMRTRMFARGVEKIAFVRQPTFSKKQIPRFSSGERPTVPAVHRHVVKKKKS